MTTITYQCDTCKRQIEKQENLTGLTVFGKCIITEGCLGKLYTLSRNIDNNREIFPSTVGGLIDYTPRKAFFNYNQTLLSPIWTILHNLSTSPAVSVYVADIDGNLNQLDPEEFNIVIINKNTLKIIFNHPVTGTAQCIARSTTLTEDTPRASSTQVQITINGLITLAIPNIIINVPPIPNIDMNHLSFTFQVNIKQPGQDEQSSLESVAPQLDISSSWNDWPKILVRKRKNYVVRTKNIFNFLAFGENAKPTDIPNGTQLRFKNIGFPTSIIRPINSKEFIFLLSTPPYATIDKLKNKLIDVGEMIGTPIDYFTYMNGELYVDSSVVDSSYPDTIKVN